MVLPESLDRIFDGGVASAILSPAVELPDNLHFETSKFHHVGPSTLQRLADAARILQPLFAKPTARFEWILDPGSFRRAISMPSERSSRRDYLRLIPC